MPDLNHEVKQVFRVKLEVGEHENYHSVYIYLEGHYLQSVNDDDFTLDGEIIKVENASIAFVRLTAYRNISEV